MNPSLFDKLMMEVLYFQVAVEKCVSVLFLPATRLVLMCVKVVRWYWLSDPNILFTGFL